YDRLGAGQTPACAQACPTTSIKFGDLAEMRSTARARGAGLHGVGVTEARLYGSDENDGVGGTGSVFLLLDEPEVYGLPPDPRVPTADLPRTFNPAGVAGCAEVAPRRPARNVQRGRGGGDRDDRRRRRVVRDRRAPAMSEARRANDDTHRA